MTCHPGTVRPCITGIESVTLIAHRTQYPIQTVSANALSAHQKGISQTVSLQSCNPVQGVCFDLLIQRPMSNLVQERSLASKAFVLLVLPEICGIECESREKVVKNLTLIFAPMFGGNPNCLGGGNCKAIPLRTYWPSLVENL